jgi:uncharacterized protein
MARPLRRAYARGMRTGTLLTVVCGLVALTAGPPPALAQPPITAGAPSATVRVEGRGEVRVTPDRARLDFAVESRAGTAEAATAENARRTEALLAAMDDAGLPADAVGTRAFGVHPIHGRDRPEGPPVIEGYRAYNVVSVRVDDLQRVGSLVDAGVGAGADRVERLRFELSNPEGVQREALARAVRDAQATAETMAGALGVTLGPVLDAASDAFLPDFPVTRMAIETEALATRPQTPIDPEEQVVTATVRLVYAIAEPAPRRPTGARR